MDDFIEFILFSVLILAILLGGLFIFLLIKNPLVAYMLVIGFFLTLAGGIGVWLLKIYRKKRLGPYHEMYTAISQSREEIMQSTKKLNRYLRRVIQDHFPKIKQLCKEAQKCVLKIQEIDKVLSSLDEKQKKEARRYQKIADNPDITRRMVDSNKRYHNNIQAIQASKNQYIQRVQQALQFLQELNSQVLALRYSHDNTKIDNDIAETIDDLLIDIRTLEEIT